MLRFWRDALVDNLSRSLRSCLHARIVFDVQQIISLVDSIYNTFVLISRCVSHRNARSNAFHIKKCSIRCVSHRWFDQSSSSIDISFCWSNVQAIIVSQYFVFVYHCRSDESEIVSFFFTCNRAKTHDNTMNEFRHRESSSLFDNERIQISKIVVIAWQRNCRLSINNETSLFISDFWICSRAIITKIDSKIVALFNTIVLNEDSRLMHAREQNEIVDIARHSLLKVRIRNSFRRLFEFAIFFVMVWFLRAAWVVSKWLEKSLWSWFSHRADSN